MEKYIKKRGQVAMDYMGILAILLLIVFIAYNYIYPQSIKDIDKSLILVSAKQLQNHIEYIGAYPINTVRNIEIKLPDSFDSIYFNFGFTDIEYFYQGKLTNYTFETNYTIINNKEFTKGINLIKIKKTDNNEISLS